MKGNVMVFFILFLLFLLGINIVCTEDIYGRIFDFLWDFGKKVFRRKMIDEDLDDGRY